MENGAVLLSIVWWRCIESRSNIESAQLQNGLFGKMSRFSNTKIAASIERNHFCSVVPLLRGNLSVKLSLFAAALNVYCATWHKRGHTLFSIWVNGMHILGVCNGFAFRDFNGINDHPVLVFCIYFISISDLFGILIVVCVDDCRLDVSSLFILINFREKKYSPSHFNLEENSVKKWRFHC